MLKPYEFGVKASIANPVLVAAGYNFRLILNWIRLLFVQIWCAALMGSTRQPAIKFG